MLSTSPMSTVTDTPGRPPMREADGCYAFSPSPGTAVSSSYLSAMDQMDEFDCQVPTKGFLTPPRMNVDSTSYTRDERGLSYRNDQHICKANNAPPRDPHARYLTAITHIPAQEATSISMPKAVQRSFDGTRASPTHATRASVQHTGQEGERPVYLSSSPSYPSAASPPHGPDGDVAALRFNLQALLQQAAPGGALDDRNDRMQRISPVSSSKSAVSVATAATATAFSPATHSPHISNRNSSDRQHRPRSSDGSSVGFSTPSPNHHRHSNVSSNGSGVDPAMHYAAVWPSFPSSHALTRDSESAEDTLKRKKSLTPPRHQVPAVNVTSSSINSSIGEFGRGAPTQSLPFTHRSIPPRSPSMSDDPFLRANASGQLQGLNRSLSDCEAPRSAQRHSRVRQEVRQARVQQDFEAQADELVRRLDEKLDLVFALLRRIMVLDARGTAAKGVQEDAGLAAGSAPVPFQANVEEEKNEDDEEDAYRDTLVRQLEASEDEAAHCALSYVELANRHALQWMNEKQFSAALQLLRRADGLLRKDAGRVFRYFPDPVELRASAFSSSENAALSPLGASGHSLSKSNMDEVASGLLNCRRPGLSTRSIKNNVNEQECSINVPFFSPSQEPARLKAAAAVEHNLGIYHFKLNEFSIAASCFARAALLEEELQAPGIAITYFNMAQTQHELHDLPDALRFVKLAEEELERQVFASKDAAVQLRRHLARNRAFTVAGLSDQTSPAIETEAELLLSNLCASSAEALQRSESIARPMKGLYTADMHTRSRRASSRPMTAPELQGDAPGEHELLQLWMQWRESVCFMSCVKQTHAEWLNEMGQYKASYLQYQQAYSWLVSVPRLAPLEQQRAQKLKERVTATKRKWRRKEVELELYQHPLNGCRAANGSRVTSSSRVPPTPKRRLSSQSKHVEQQKNQQQREAVCSSGSAERIHTWRGLPTPLQSTVVTSVLPPAVEVADARRSRHSHLFSHRPPHPVTAAVAATSTSANAPSPVSVAKAHRKRPNSANAAFYSAYMPRPAAPQRPPPSRRCSGGEPAVDVEFGAAGYAPHPPSAYEPMPKPPSTPHGRPSWNASTRVPVPPPGSRRTSHLSSDPSNRRGFDPETGARHNSASFSVGDSVHSKDITAAAMDSKACMRCSVQPFPEAMQCSSQQQEKQVDKRATNKASASFPSSADGVVRSLLFEVDVESPKRPPIHPLTSHLSHDQAPLEIDKDDDAENDDVVSSARVSSSAADEKQENVGKSSLNETDDGDAVMSVSLSEASLPSSPPPPPRPRGDLTWCVTVLQTFLRARGAADHSKDRMLATETSTAGADEHPSPCDLYGTMATALQPNVSVRREPHAAMEVDVEEEERKSCALVPESQSTPQAKEGIAAYFAQSYAARSLEATDTTKTCEPVQQSNQHDANNNSVLCFHMEGTSLSSQHEAKGSERCDAVGGTTGKFLDAVGRSTCPQNRNVCDDEVIVVHEYSTHDHANLTKSHGEPMNNTDDGGNESEHEGRIQFWALEPHGDANKEGANEVHFLQEEKVVAHRGEERSISNVSKHSSETVVAHHDNFVAALADHSPLISKDSVNASSLDRRSFISVDAQVESENDDNADPHTLLSVSSSSPHESASSSNYSRSSSANVHKDGRSEKTQACESPAEENNVKQRSTEIQEQADNVMNTPEDGAGAVSFESSGVNHASRDELSHEHRDHSKSSLGAKNDDADASRHHREEGSHLHMDSSIGNEKHDNDHTMDGEEREEGDVADQRVVDGPLEGNVKAVEHGDASGETEETDCEEAIHHNGEAAQHNEDHSHGEAANVDDSANEHKVGEPGSISRTRVLWVDEHGEACGNSDHSNHTNENTASAVDERKVFQPEKIEEDVLMDLLSPPCEENAAAAANYGMLDTNDGSKAAQLQPRLTFSLDNIVPTPPASRHPSYAYRNPSEVHLCKFSSSFMSNAWMEGEGNAPQLLEQHPSVDQTSPIGNGDKDGEDVHAAQHSNDDSKKSSPAMPSSDSKDPKCHTYVGPNRDARKGSVKAADAAQLLAKVEEKNAVAQGEQQEEENESPQAEGPTLCLLSAQPSENHCILDSTQKEAMHQHTHKNNNSAAVTNPAAKSEDGARKTPSRSQSNGNRFERDKETPDNVGDFFNDSNNFLSVAHVNHGHSPTPAAETSPATTGKGFDSSLRAEPPIVTQRLGLPKKRRQSPRNEEMFFLVASPHSSDSGPQVSHDYAYGRRNGSQTAHNSSRSGKETSEGDIDAASILKSPEKMSQPPSTPTSRRPRVFVFVPPRMATLGTPESAHLTTFFARCEDSDRGRTRYDNADSSAETPKFVAFARPLAAFANGAARHDGEDTGGSRSRIYPSPSLTTGSLDAPLSFTECYYCDAPLEEEGTMGRRTVSSNSTNTQISQLRASFWRSLHERGEVKVEDGVLHSLWSPLKPLYGASISTHLLAAASRAGVSSGTGAAMETDPLAIAAVAGDKSSDTDEKTEDWRAFLQQLIFNHSIDIVGDADAPLFHARASSRAKSSPTGQVEETHVQPESEAMSVIMEDNAGGDSTPTLTEPNGGDTDVAPEVPKTDENVLENVAAVEEQEAKASEASPVTPSHLLPDALVEEVPEKESADQRIKEERELSASASPEDIVTSHPRSGGAVESTSDGDKSGFAQHEDEIQEPSNSVRINVVAHAALQHQIHENDTHLSASLPVSQKERSSTSSSFGSHLPTQAPPLGGGSVFNVAKMDAEEAERCYMREQILREESATVIQQAWRKWVAAQHPRPTFPMW